MSDVQGQRGQHELVGARRRSAARGNRRHERQRGPLRGRGRQRRSERDAELSGRLREVIAVTAVDKNLRGYIHANHGDYIDVAAPGVEIWTALPGVLEGYQSGTSFAAPHVTAILAAAHGRVQDKSKEGFLKALCDPRPRPGRTRSHLRPRPCHGASCLLLRETNPADGSPTSSVRRPCLRRRSHPVSASGSGRRFRARRSSDLLANDGPSAGDQLGLLRGLIDVAVHGGANRGLERRVLPLPPPERSPCWSAPSAPRSRAPGRATGPRRCDKRSPQSDLVVSLPIS